MTGILSPHWELKPEPCYQPVPPGTLPPLSPSLCPQTSSFPRRLAALVPACLRLPACGCRSAAGHHATPHTRRLLGAGAQEASRGLVPAEQGSQAAALSWSCSECPAAPELCSPLLQNVQLLLWQESGCLPAWDQLLQILYSCYPFQGIYFPVPGQGLWSANKDVKQPLCWAHRTGDHTAASELLPEASQTWDCRLATLTQLYCFFFCS